MSDTDAWAREREVQLLRLAGLELTGRQIKNPASPLRITLARSDEAPLVHCIMQEAFAELASVLQPPSGAMQETVEDVRKAMSVGGALLAWEGETAVASVRFELQPNHLYVGRLAVLPTQRGRGIASAVMVSMETVARCLERSEIRLGTRMRLPQNIALYRKLGFEIEEVCQHARGPDLVALLVKRLDGEGTETLPSAGR